MCIRDRWYGIRDNNRSRGLGDVYKRQLIEIFPEAMGRFFVLSTLLSNFLSDISLMIHPADLINIEPDKNKNK